VKRIGDSYLLFLCVVLAGYALIGKGFAYVGYPPIYIGEIALLSGCFVFLRTGAFVALHATLPSLFLIVSFIWVVFRTLPYVLPYGTDALRDSVVITYSAFAFIMIGLLLEDPRRLNDLIRRYSNFLPIFIPVVCVSFFLSHYLGDSMPNLPGTTVPLILLFPTEVAVHLTGAVVFVLVGLRKLPVILIVPVLLSLGLSFALSRGAMLAFIIPVSLATIVLGRTRELIAALMIGLAIFATAYFVETSVTVYHEARNSEERSVSTRQIINNIESIGGRGGAQTDGTKQWRLRWWDIITNETFDGPFFWTGRGFGVNLAEVHGFRSHKPAQRPLRSPHNAHLTILARAGVTGLVLWIGLLGSWLWMMIHAMWTARNRNHSDWGGIFLFLSCYASSAVINASFDVALEGPMQGVWFWCLFGLGIACVMIYRTQLAYGPSHDPEPARRAQLGRV
jgi:hypothetical protein